MRIKKFNENKNDDIMGTIEMIYEDYIFQHDSCNMISESKMIDLTSVLNNKNKTSSITSPRISEIHNKSIWVRKMIRSTNCSHPIMFMVLTDEITKNIDINNEFCFMSYTVSLSFPYTIYRELLFEGIKERIHSLFDLSLFTNDKYLTKYRGDIDSNCVISFSYCDSFIYDKIKKLISPRFIM